MPLHPMFLHLCRTRHIWHFDLLVFSERDSPTEWVSLHLMFVHLPWIRHQHPSFWFNSLFSCERIVPSEWVFGECWRRHFDHLQTRLGGWVLRGGILGGRSCFVPCLAWKGERGTSYGTIVQTGCIAYWKSKISLTKILILLFCVLYFVFCILYFVFCILYNLVCT